MQESEVTIKYSVYYIGSDQEHSSLCFYGRNPALFDTEKEAEDHKYFLANDEALTKFYKVCTILIPM